MEDAICNKIIFGTCLSTTYIQFSAIGIRDWLTLFMLDLIVLTALPWLSPEKYRNEYLTPSESDWFSLNSLSCLTENFVPNESYHTRSIFIMLFYHHQKCLILVLQNVCYDAL